MCKLGHLSWNIFLLLLMVFIPSNLSRADDDKRNPHIMYFNKVTPNINRPIHQNVIAPPISNNHIHNNYSPPPHPTISNTYNNSMQQNQHINAPQVWGNNGYHDRTGHWVHNHHRNHHYYHQTIIYVPYYYFNYYPDSAINQPSTDQAWISASDGYVPNNAIVYQTISGNPIYYCRVYYQDNFIVGILLPSDGCYIEINSENIGFENYQVLISSY